ncbi:hypothetical protein [Actinoplanes sp. NPDC049265]|uniref:hypothetical protein n=1 Tax=Actinoplanes sp. NPDC049265 TaxID=3363902 RepID=UPI00371CBAF0
MSLRSRVPVALTAAAAAVLVGATAAGAEDRAIEITGVSFSVAHVDVTSGDADVVLTWTVTDVDPAALEVSGSVELRQFAGATAVGATTFIPYDAVLVGVAPGEAPRATSRVHLPVPRYGSTSEAVWRVTKLTAHDGNGNFRALRGDGVAEFGVTQLVETDGPVLDQIALAPGQNAKVVDTGGGVTLDYRITASDLQAGLWKGRLTLAGPDGRRVSSLFSVASDGRHLTCGFGSLINNIYDRVECAAQVDIPAGTPAGTWTPARLALTDQAGNTRILNHLSGPAITVTAA